MPSTLFHCCCTKIVNHFRIVNQRLHSSQSFGRYVNEGYVWNRVRDIFNICCNYVIIIRCSSSSSVSKAHPMGLSISVCGSRFLENLATRMTRAHFWARWCNNVQKSLLDHTVAAIGIGSVDSHFCKHDLRSLFNSDLGEFAPVDTTACYSLQLSDSIASDVAWRISLEL
jgi:hypothetical protein